MIEYGLDPVEAQRAFDAQRGACAICERPFSKAKKRNADHCHATGHFRGFLCGGCNTAIGLLHDDPAWLDRAAAYLRHHSSRLASLPPRKRVPLRLLDIPGLAVLDEKGYPRSLLAVSWGNSGDGLQPTVDVEQTRANVVAWFAGKPLSEETRRRLEDPAPMTQEDLAVLLSRIVDAKMKG
jgi:hypothetical protein